MTKKKDPDEIIEVSADQWEVRRQKITWKHMVAIVLVIAFAILLSFGFLFIASIIFIGFIILKIVAFILHKIR